MIFSNKIVKTWRFTEFLHWGSCGNQIYAWGVMQKSDFFSVVLWWFHEFFYRYRNLSMAIAYIDSYRNLYFKHAIFQRYRYIFLANRLLNQFRYEHLHTGTSDSLWDIPDQQFFMIRRHSNKKPIDTEHRSISRDILLCSVPMVFGILSSGNLGLIKQFSFSLLHTASTASYLKNSGIQLDFWWFKQGKLFQHFKLNWC